ncbi:MAG TPA: sugar-binding transcriptional regulator [Candidatus Limiplasma sp.]|nr:sugar-binding transcriptional regulator [Candidatus Limiplasma sp.]HPS82210.1 sugar-binding transcriptional regulator [Candidatus Limiplasma sp.]
MDYEESLMIKIAWYYYFENMTQQSVADTLGISRMRVIKLLEKARQTGIIQFRLRKDGETRMKLERGLMETYGLKDAFIVPSSLNKSQVNAGIAEAASMYIAERLSENSFINIGYGDTPNRVLNNLATMAEHPITCVSLTGGVSYYLPDTRSNVFNAKLHLIPTPLLASSKEMATAMRQESSVTEISRMISLAQLTVVGIGSMHESATIFKSGILNRNDFLYLQMQGAVGDLLSHFINSDGKLIETPLEERLISTPLTKLKALKNVIGVAAGDVKVNAIRAALRGGYLDVLISDDNTASQLLNQPEEV